MVGRAQSNPRGHGKYGRVLETGIQPVGGCFHCSGCQEILGRRPRPLARSAGRTGSSNASTNVYPDALFMRQGMGCGPPSRRRRNPREMGHDSNLIFVTCLRSCLGPHRAQGGTSTGWWARQGSNLRPIGYEAGASKAGGRSAVTPLFSVSPAWIMPAVEVPSDRFRDLISPLVSDDHAPHYDLSRQHKVRGLPLITHASLINIT